MPASPPSGHDNPLLSAVDPVGDASAWVDDILDSDLSSVPDDAPPSPPHDVRPRRPSSPVRRSHRQNDSQKLLSTVRRWKKVYSLERFLLNYASLPVPNYRPVAYRRRKLTHAIQKLEADGILAIHETSPRRPTESTGREDLLLETLKHEFELLPRTRSFGKWDPTPQSLDALDYDFIMEELRTNAPTWTKIVLQLMEHPKAKYSPKATEENNRRQSLAYKRLINLTASVSHGRHQKRSNFIPKAVGQFLYTNGARRRVISFLAEGGICEGYHATLSDSNAVGEKAKSTEVDRG